MEGLPKFLGSLVTFDDSSVGSEDVQYGNFIRAPPIRSVVMPIIPNYCGEMAQPDTHLALCNMVNTYSVVGDSV
jgi:hypothetical protein